MPRSEIKFNSTKKDAKLIDQIVMRAVQLRKINGMETDAQSVTMDITACHLNDCKLDLEKLLAADDFNLAHDVFGIGKYLDRSTGKLTQCFLPRCSAKD